MRRIALLTAAAALLCAGTASAADLSFEFENTTSSAVVEFYAAPVGVQNWEANMASSPLAPGATTTANISDPRDVCRYDIHVVFADGEETTDEDVNLCETGTYTVSE